VQPGDECGKIAENYQVQDTDIHDAFGVQCSDFGAELKPGDRLTIANCFGCQKDFPLAVPSACPNCFMVQVNDGDTCKDIADNYKVSAEKQLNHLNADGSRMNCASFAKSLQVNDYLEVCGCDWKNNYRFGCKHLPGRCPPEPAEQCLKEGKGCEGPLHSPSCCPGLKCVPDSSSPLGGYCEKASSVGFLAQW
jgi:hypothetical protein